MIDTHTHTTLSDGKMTPQELEALAKKLGVEFGISDHISPRHRINTDETFKEYLEELSGIDCYKSAEIDLEFEIPISDELLGQLDYLIGGLHSIDYEGENIYFFGEGRRIEDGELFVEMLLTKIIEGIERYPVDIVAHSTYIPDFVEGDSIDLWTEERKLRLIEASVENDVSIEISNHWYVPDRSFIGMALDRGVKFSMGSDGHSADTVFDLEYPLKIVDEMGLTSKNIFIPKRTSSRVKKRFNYQ